MQRTYLVCYDIRDDRRLRRVHKICKGYGTPWQYSIFLCNLKDIDRVKLENELTEQMNLKQDQALIIPLGLDEREVRDRTSILGVSLPEAYLGAGEPGGAVVI